MAKQLRYWKCGSCGETLQGIKSDGEFISDKELGSGAPARFRAVGCYLCGYSDGEFIEGDHPETDAEYADRVGEQEDPTP